MRLESPALSDSELFAQVTKDLCDAAIRVNKRHLELHPETPRLYESGVVYTNEVRGLPDELVDIPVLLRRGRGDCFQLVAWRAAELCLDGIPASAAVMFLSDEARLEEELEVRAFHVVVRRFDGILEDPSARLGMGTLGEVL